MALTERLGGIFKRRETAQSPVAHLVEAGRNLVGGTVGMISQQIRGAVGEVVSLGKDGLKAVADGFTFNPLKAAGRLALAPLRIANRLVKTAGRAASGVTDAALSVPKTIYDTGSEVVLAGGEAALRSTLMVGRIGLTPVAIAAEIKDKLFGALGKITDKVATGLAPKAST